MWLEITQNGMFAWSDMICWSKMVLDRQLVGKFKLFTVWLSLILSKKN